MNQQVKGYLLLLFTALLWGFAFLFQKNVTNTLDAFSFNAIRFAIATLAISLLFLLPKSIFNYEAPSAEVEQGLTKRRKNYSVWWAGGIAGVFLFIGITLQQIGLHYTTTGKSGFITSLCIIFVPILALFLGQRCHYTVWLGGLMAFAGIYVLSMNQLGGEESKLNLGDFLTLISAIFWALQVLWLAVVAKYSHLLKIAMMQMATGAVLSFLSLIFMVLIGKATLPSWDAIYSIKMAIFYTGVISAAVGFTLQIFGQRHVPAPNAALVMSLEGVFAMLAGLIFLKEPLTIYIAIGCLLIFSGIVVAQIHDIIKNKS